MPAKVDGFHRFAAVEGILFVLDALKRPYLFFLLYPTHYPSSQAAKYLYRSSNVDGYPPLLFLFGARSEGSLAPSSVSSEECSVVNSLSVGNVKTKQKNHRGCVLY